MPDAAPASAEPVLVLNAGSSSLKARLSPAGVAVGIERIGEDAPSPVTVGGRREGERRVPDVATAIQVVLDALGARSDTPRIELVGHRVVHGGERHRAPLRISDRALQDLEALAPLAPLHLPGNLAGIRAARTALPDAIQVAVFDTAFHAGLPRRAYLYGLPMRLYREEGVRRYGFHGPSHDVVSTRIAERLGRSRGELRIVTLHLGNGASAAAVQFGRSVDTTMGFTPLEGLMMGTRPGDVDPGILMHLLRQGWTAEALDRTLNRSSGLLGLSGVSNDLRDVWAAADGGDEDAAAALEVYAYRIRKTIGAYAAAMGGLDAVAFTGGVGENDARMRAAATEELDFLGLRLDPDANAAHGPRIGAQGARVACWVIPTDEEGRIAELVRAAARGEDGA
ncbi:MAG: acetate/propionate family kinase [Trueperaceae bacterium]|nr:acetate/propionate family kinase [Trueperaceae bacterium]